LYSFEARNDCVAVDEPLYRDWLVHRGESVQRPYTNELVHGTAPQDADNNTIQQWKRELLSLEDRFRNAADQLADGGVVFCKHMAKHACLYPFESQVTLDAYGVKLIHKHLLLIRDPVAILSSWGVSALVHGSNPTPDEVGIVPLLQIYSMLSTTAPQQEHAMAILDSDELIRNPQEVLRSVCTSLNVPYTDAMMTWPSGPHKCDGPWAKWWYEDVHKSSGWTNKTQERYRTLPPSLMNALLASYPAYQFLQTLTRGYKLRGPDPKIIYEDARNEHLIAYVGAPGRGRLIPREMAAVSPWDSSVQGGDAAWEGLRVYRGVVLSLEKHLRRLMKSAKALGFENVHSKEEITEALFRTLAANGMRDGAHVRLTLTRGEKSTSSMNPIFNVYGTTLIILAEWKPTEGATTYDNTKGISLITASQRRNSPQTCDSKIHHNNLINNILPKIQANLAGCADAIMLDLEGYVSETNATNLFMVDNGILLTPPPDHCLPGITRATVIELAKELNISCVVRRLSLAEFHSADEVFTTGTMGELTPVTCIDGRVIGTGERGPITIRLQDAYSTLPERPGWAIPIPVFEK
jgi:branched-chain amino acid aminotransferase group I